MVRGEGVQVAELFRRQATKSKTKNAVLEMFLSLYQKANVSGEK